MMKLLDISKCHVDSPDFKADLATLEVSASRRDLHRVYVPAVQYFLDLPVHVLLYNVA